MTPAVEPSSPLGAYVHIPFCHRRCDYCAFATWTDRAHLVDRYMDALVRDARQQFDDRTGRPVSSVFFGGGTPSLVDPSLLALVLDAIPRCEGAEVTVECNPDTITGPLLDAYLGAGVTRVSLGVQSMEPRVLASLGREHDVAAVDRAAQLVRERPFASWNVDLIYGAVGESVHDWAATLDRVLALAPPHVSAYALTVEAGTPLADAPARHPDDDDQATKYELADAAFAAAGMPWYEISNWARPGHPCRHNELYWQQGDYLAFGCAAHGHAAGRRWWNVRTPDRYIDCIESGRSPEAGAEVLSAAVRRREEGELAIRTRHGVPSERLPDEVLTSLPVGLVETVGDRRVLTLAGRLLANEVALRLV